MDLPLLGVVVRQADPEPRRVQDEGENPPAAPAVQLPAWRARYADMARRGKGSDAQWLAGALLAAHGQDARGVLRQWVAQDGPRKTWGRADALLAEMGVPERVQMEAFDAVG